MTAAHHFNDLLLQKMQADPRSVEDQAFDYFSRRLETGRVIKVRFHRHGDELRLHLRLEINGQHIVYDKVWPMWAFQLEDHPITQLFERELNKAVASAGPAPTVDLKDQPSREPWDGEA